MDIPAELTQARPLPRGQLARDLLIGAAQFINTLARRGDVTAVEEFYNSLPVEIRERFIDETVKVLTANRDAFKADADFKMLEVERTIEGVQSLIDTPFATFAPEPEPEAVAVAGAPGLDLPQGIVGTITPTAE